MRRILLLAAAFTALSAWAPSAHAGLVVWAKNPGTVDSALDWGELWIANDDGSQARPLLRPQGRLPGIPIPYGAERLSDPHLSADGKSLTFSAQWNLRWYRGQATSCGVGCGGLYRLRNGVISRLTRAVPRSSANGCPGFTVLNLCQTFEERGRQVGAAIIFLGTTDAWTGCGASGCPLAPTAIGTSLEAYTPSSSRPSTVLNWRNECAGGNEPQNESFDANPNGMILTGCQTAQGTNIELSDFNTSAPVARFYSPPLHLALSRDARWVLAATGQPGSNDANDVWRFTATTSADVKGPSDYLIAIRNTDVWRFHSPVFAGRFIVSDATDGNLYRFPGYCGLPTSPGITCTRANATAITRDARPTLFPGSGYSRLHVRNSDPTWSPARTASLGGARTAPRAGSPYIWCKSGGTRCPIVGTWIASLPGVVRFTFSTGGRVVATASASTTVGPNGKLLGIRLPRLKVYRVSVSLTANGRTSRAATATVTLH